MATTEVSVQSLDDERTNLLRRNNAKSDSGRTENWNCWAVVTNYSTILYKALNSDMEVLRLPIADKWIPVRMHLLWLVFVSASTIPAFCTSLLLGTYTLVMIGPVLFLTVLLHELGHVIAALVLGGEVDSILLWPLGGLGTVSFTGDISIVTDGLVSIAGPLMHIPQLAFWSLCMYFSNHGSVTLITPLNWDKDFWLSVCSGAMTIQLALFIFNMLPAYPLDGGHLLKALLTYLNLLPGTVSSITAFVGSMFGWYFVLGGLHGPGEAGRGNSSTSLLQLVSGSNELCIGVYMLVECYALWQEGTPALHEEDQVSYVSAPTNATSSTLTPSVPVAAAGVHATNRGAPVIHTLASVPSTSSTGAPAGMVASANSGSGSGGMYGAGRRLGSAAD
jgi:Zn-dependent protease